MFTDEEFTLLIYFTVSIGFVVFNMKYALCNGHNYSKLNSKPLWRDCYFLIPCLIYSFLLGFRYDFAYDWSQYKETFLYLEHGTLFREDTEIGYLFVNKVLILLGLNYYSIFILEGFVWILSIAMLLRKEKKYYLFSFLFVTILNRFDCLNISRQFFAMSILYIAYSFLLDNKKKYFLLFALMAITVHSSALIFVIPFYFLDKSYDVKLIYVLMIYFLLLIFREKVFDFIINSSTIVQGYILTQKRYDADFITNEMFMRQGVQLSRMIREGFVDISYILCYYSLKHNPKVSKKIETLLFLGMIGIIIRIAFGTNEITSRTAFYFTVFSHIGMGIMTTLAFTLQAKYKILYILVGLIFIINLIFYDYSHILLEFSRHFYIQYNF